MILQFNIMIISLGFWSESWNIEGVWASQIFKATKPIDNSGKFKGRELMPCFSIRWYNGWFYHKLCLRQIPNKSIHWVRQQSIHWVRCPDIVSHDLDESHCLNFRGVCLRDTWLKILMAASSDVSSREVSSGRTGRMRENKGCKGTTMMSIAGGDCGNVKRMITVLEAFHWWGWLGYLLRTSSVPSCFHLTVKQDKRGLNFYDSTLARPKVSITSAAQTLFWQREFIQSAYSRQPCDHCAHYGF